MTTDGTFWLARINYGERCCHPSVTTRSADALCQGTHILQTVRKTLSSGVYRPRNNEQKKKKKKMPGYTCDTVLLHNARCVGFRFIYTHRKRLISLSLS